MEENTQQGAPTPAPAKVSGAEKAKRTITRNDIYGMLLKLAYEKHPRCSHLISQGGGSCRRTYNCNVCGACVDTESAKWKPTVHAGEAKEAHIEMHISEFWYKDYKEARKATASVPMKVNEAQTRRRYYGELARLEPTASNRRKARRAAERAAKVTKQFAPAIHEQMWWVKNMPSAEAIEGTYELAQKRNARATAKADGEHRKKVALLTKTIEPGRIPWAEPLGDVQAFPSVPEAKAYLEGAPFGELEVAEGKRDAAVVRFVTVSNGGGNVGKLRNGGVMHQPKGGVCWHALGACEKCKEV